MSKIRKNTKRKRNQYGGINYTKTFKKRKTPRKQTGSGKKRKNPKRRRKARYLTKFQGPMRSV